MRSLMVEEFREFDLDALEWAIRFKSISPTVVGNFPIFGVEPCAVVLHRHLYAVRIH